MFEAADLSRQYTRLQQLEQQASTEGFWDQQDKAAAVNQEISEINETLRLTSTLQAQIDNIATAVELIEMEVSLHKLLSTGRSWHEAAMHFCPYICHELVTHYMDILACVRRLLCLLLKHVCMPADATTVACAV